MSSLITSSATFFLLILYFDMSYANSEQTLNEFQEEDNAKSAVQFKDYSVIKPYIKVLDSEDNHITKLTLQFEAFSRDFLLDLQMNKNLFPSHFVEKHQKNGTTVINKPYEKHVKHCYYNGHLRGVDVSWAAISLCDGISGVIFDGSKMMFLESTERNKITVYRKSDFINQNFSCGYKDSSNSHHNLRIPRKAEIREPYNSNRQSKYLELILVNDLSVFKQAGENKDAIFARNKEVANILNSLYNPLNIFIALVGIEIWSEYDQINISDNLDLTLTNFLAYRRIHLASNIPHDNAQLIIGKTFYGGIVAKALKGTMCTNEYSGGVNMDFTHNVGLLASNIAHTIGHNFGMEHDTTECACPEERCIMAASFGSNVLTRWSSCSMEYLALAFQMGLDYCLHNKPSELAGGSTCGNGFVEKGEECDCGLKQYCNNTCCDADSCKLFPNATCATGKCCDLSTCQKKSANTECRSVKNECDFPEFCDGKNEYCPGDVFKQDGISCKNNEAYCYQGKCQSHNDQCKLLWGPTGQMSHARCFDWNTRGRTNGNCGYFRQNQTYQSCEKEDVLCGRLHCTHLNMQLKFGLEATAILSQSFINFEGKILACRSAIVDLGLDSIDPGLVPNGAKCGDNKICKNQKCVSVAEVKQHCPQDCNKHGICDNKGNCHCEIGFEPPYCDVSGLEKSINSTSTPYPKPITIYSFPGQTVILRCEDKIEPNSTIIWFFKGKEIDLKNKTLNVESNGPKILKINLHDEIAFDSYACESSDGSVKTTFKLVKIDEKLVTFGFLNLFFT